MSAATATNGNPSVDSKAAKKRKASRPGASAQGSSGDTESPAGETIDLPTTGPELASGVDGVGESEHLKTLNRNIRNIHKKLVPTKADAVLAQNPGTSLDELVAQKKLNADQKAQIEKKPQLQEQLKHLEEEVKRYREFEHVFNEKHAQEKAKLIESHRQELDKAKTDAAAEERQSIEQRQDEDLLLLSRFLHAAASKRQSDAKDSDRGRAFEGALLLVYQGNQDSLNCLKNLVAGSDDKVPDVDGCPVDCTFAEIRQSSIDDAPELHGGPDDDVVDIAAGTTAEGSSAAVDSDPTIAHAGLTELEDTATYASTNGVVNEDMSIPAQASTTNEAANAVAASTWDAQASMTESATGNDWVEVPRDPGETDAGVTATPAANHNTSSWAEEVTESAVIEEKATVENDGFEQVVHHPNRERGGRGRGRGADSRGRGRGGEFRGSRGRGGGGGGGGGDRGDGGDRRGGRGRGRGDGTRGGPRGGRGRDGSGEGAGNEP